MSVIQKEFSHLQIPLEDIISATNNFADENLIAQEKYKKIYKGQLLQSEIFINIVARRLDPEYAQGSKEFMTEISMLSSLKHQNLVTIVGFCDENQEKIIIIKHEVNESLDKHLSGSTLTWTQRLRICVGVASALSYIHYDEDRDFSVVHRNIKCSNVLLDDNLEPKLSGFELSTKTSAARRHRLLLAEVVGTIGYIDPAYETTGGFTVKSDVFSLGVVLFEVLFGHIASSNPKTYEDHWYFAKLAKLYYEETTLDNMIDPYLRKQMDLQAFNTFSETAYFCLKEERTKRPNMDQVVRRLEKALDLQYKHENAELSIVDAKAKVTSSDHHKMKIADYIYLSRNPPATDVLSSCNPPTNQANGNIISSSLQVFSKLRIPLENIASATNNFADDNMFGQGGFGKLYRGQLLWLGDSIDIVARRLDSTYGQGERELLMEVSMLSSLKHKNLVSIVGFCDENGEKIIIYEHAIHASLDQHLSQQTLTGTQRLQICSGVAHALHYMHYDGDVIHCDINSSKVLIDKDWEARVFGFGLSTKFPGNWRHRLLFSHYFETSTSRDQVFMNTRSVTPKYDVYYFGMLLYKVLCGREPMIKDNGFKETLDDMIDLDLRKQMDRKLLNIYSNIAYKCLNQGVDRPTMFQIVKELEGAFDAQGELENLEYSVLADEATSSISLTEEDKEKLEICLSDIKFATKDFNKAYRIGKGGFSEVYRADLELKDELHKRFRTTVAIKRIVNIKKQNKQDFFAEVAMLNSCKHENIISLFGISSEYPEMILVCEFASRGSLDDCLEKNKMIDVTWAQRLQICLDIAHGLNYLHGDKVGKSRIIHRDVKSANVLLDENWRAKVADFGLSKFHPKNQSKSSIHTIHLAGTEMYVDPEYSTTGTYKRESDIYSFGVVLFEILSGRLAYHLIYNIGNDKGLAAVARRRMKERTLKELIDPDMLEDADEHIFTVNKGPNQKSLDTFLKIAHQCLAETQKERPLMKVIIEELQKALNIQGKTLVLMKFRLSDLQLATNNFADKCCIGVGAYGMIYNAPLNHFDRNSLSIEGRNGGELPQKRNVALKRIFNREDGHGKQGFFAEIDILASFKHPNIVSLLGISSQDREMVLVYEDAFKGSLHDCIVNTHKRASLTWVRRIQMSLDIADGLNYLHAGTEDKQRLMQFDVNCANILLDTTWRAKIACFWLSIFPANQDDDTYKVLAKKVQLDPEYIKISKLKKNSGIYSFGVILFEILCGRLDYDETYYVENEKGLPTIAQRRFIQGTLIEMIDPILLMDETEESKCLLKKEVNENSFSAFTKIANQCLTESHDDRPSMEVIIKELQNALNLQVEHLEHLKIHVMQKRETLEHLKIHLSDIQLATNNFAKTHLIGSGGYAMVYKAEVYFFDVTSLLAIEGKYKRELPKRRDTVAIKRIFERIDEQGEQGFLAEIETLSNCKHPNIVSLFGFCDEGPEMLLIYEYATNGSLDDYLGNTDYMTNFTWAQRIQICLDIAHGIDYLHTSTKEKQMIIHRDIKTANILLDDNWMAKICDFGLSKFHLGYKQHSSLNTYNIAGTELYLDPEYLNTGKLKKASDIYSFGVVLFELMCGKLAYDRAYGEKGLPSVARQVFEAGMIKKLMDPKLREEDENLFMLNGGLSQDSVNTFSNIAYQCLAETQAKRPTIQVVIQELKEALSIQKKHKNKFQISLEDLTLATQNFSSYKCIGEGRYWKQYEGEIPHANGFTTVIIKRFDSKSDHQFLKELEVLFEYKHENIIGLAGYCNDMDEKVVVYEQVSNGKLNKHLQDADLTWMQRLKVCIDVSRGLHFLHIGGVTEDIPIMHRDIKSACILLNGYWTAKISNFELSLQSWEREHIEQATDNAFGSLGYMDPEYKRSGYLTEKSDIYSLGVVLLETLCGRLAWAEGCEDHSQSLGPLAKRCYGEGRLDELVFQGIKEQIDPQSLTTFIDVAIRCLDDIGNQRPEASEVVSQLKRALEFQEDYDIWEPKLPRDYEKILRFSKVKETLSTDTTKKRDIYNLLREGILLQDRDVFLSLGSNGEKNYMISAKKISYKNRWALNWRNIPQSRFENAVEMLSLSNLKFNIKTRTRFLSSGVNYGVHLVFKFCSPRQFSSKSMYVNLTYKMRGETFYAYFATWRDKEWMMIELYRFLNHNEQTHIEVLLESFSRHYRGSKAIHIEGIEFRAIDSVKNEEIEKIMEVHQQFPTNPGKILGRIENDDKGEKKMFLQDEVDVEEHLMLSAKEVLYDSSNVKLFHHLKPARESRLQELIELLPQQVCHIKCKIESQMLSPDTDYMCYLVFKLSDKCRGLHCPVKVRDILHWNNKGNRIIYFRSPNPWNLHDKNWVAEQRKDGWMEVSVWKFNSTSQLRKDRIPTNLKLITYEGTMSGLIVCGLEIRPM